MTRILGIDPGSNITGFGILDVNGKTHEKVAADSIKLKGDFFVRMRALVSNLSEVINTYKPDVVSIEQVFVHRNVQAALKLGQARGVAISVIVTNSIPIYEYTPREIKQALVGYGGADKAQIQHMIKLMLNLKVTPEPDTADALAIAFCHASNMKFLQHTGSYHVDNYTDKKISKPKKSKKNASWRQQVSLLEKDKSSK